VRTAHGELAHMANWHMAKRGSIIFLCRKIIMKLNETFSPINSVRLISLSWLKQADRLKKTLLDEENMQFIQVYIL